MGRVVRRFKKRILRLRTVIRVRTVTITRVFRTVTRININLTKFRLRFHRAVVKKVIKPKVVVMKLHAKVSKKAAKKVKKIQKKLKTKKLPAKKVAVLKKKLAKVAKK